MDNSLTGIVFEIKNVGHLDFTTSILSKFIGCGIYLETNSRLSMQYSEINSNIYKDGISEAGTGVYCYLCDSFNISKSTFKALSATTTGGSIMSLPYTTGNLNNLDSTNFTSCSAATGGALYLSSTNILITSSNFRNNIADNRESSTYFGQGAGIFLTYPSNFYTSKIVSSIFVNNTAQVSGGGVQWYDSMPEFTKSSFLSNAAYYGQDIASFSYKIYVDSSRRLSISDIPPGQTLKNPIVAEVKDHYNNTVLTDNQSTAEITASNFNDYIISGLSKVVAKSGMYTFSDITISGPPGSQTTLQIAGDFTALGSGTAKLNITVNLRNCVSGEASISNSQCEVCAEGFYSIVAGSACQVCPTGGICYGGNHIVAASGYWRTSDQSDVFYPCPNPAACLEEAINKTSEICASGYVGNLCQSCKVGYSRNGDNNCTPCLDKDKNILMLSGLLLLAVCIVVILTVSNIKGAYKEQAITSIYFKILMTYLQIIMLTISFDLNWPSLVLDMFSAQSKVGGSSDQLFSIDCFIGSTFNPYYAKLILLALLPAICALFSLIFWLLWGKLRHSTHLKEKIIGSVVVQLFFFQPSLVKYNFSMFDCMELAPGQSYMTGDMSIQCWQSEHLAYSLGLVVPSIAIWCVGIPLILLWSLFRHRNKLGDIEEKLKYGFLYKGFKSDRFYWEFLTMLRKMLIICTSVFLKNISVPIQALVTFIIILISYILNEKCSPYNVHQLNAMEIKSIIVSAVTIYSGLFFLTGNLNQEMKLLLFVGMVLSNITFLSYWIYYTFGFYIAKIYVSLRCCKRFLGPRLHHWIAQVLPEEDVNNFDKTDNTDISGTMCSPVKTDVSLPNFKMSWQDPKIRKSSIFEIKS